MSAIMEPLFCFDSVSNFENWILLKLAKQKNPEMNFFYIALPKIIERNVTSFTEKSGNTEQGKCRLMNECLFFMFLIGRWYNEKKISL